MLAGHGPKPGDFRGAIDGGNYLWISPTYKQIENSFIWRDLKRACKGAVKHPGDIREGDREIRLMNDATIRVMSADGEDSLRGAGVDGMVIDEAARIKSDVWQEVLRPMLADKRGWCVMATTPNGKNWFQRLFQRVKGGDMGGEWAAWRLPTSENPLIDEKELASMRQAQDPRSFAQECLAEFTAIEGAAFPGDYFDENIWAQTWPDTFGFSAMGVDWSLGKGGDPSAIVFVGVTGEVQYVDASIKQRPPGQLVDDIIAMNQQYQPEIVAVEVIGFPTLVSDIARRCIELRLPIPRMMPVESHPKFEGGKTGRIIAGLDYHLRHHLVRLRKTGGCETLLDQLQMLNVGSFNDDGPDAWEMAIRIMNQVAVAGR